MSDKRPNNQLVLAFAEVSRSEAPRDSVEGTESFAAERNAESPASNEQLMEEVCGRKNCQQALARVKSNKGRHHFFRLSQRANFMAGAHR